MPGLIRALPLHFQSNFISLYTGWTSRSRSQVLQYMPSDLQSAEFPLPVLSSCCHDPRSILALQGHFLLAYSRKLYSFHLHNRKMFLCCQCLLISLSLAGFSILLRQPASFLFFPLKQSLPENTTENFI